MASSLLMVTFPFCMAGLSVDLTPGPGSATAGSTDYSITCAVTGIVLKAPSITWRSPGDMMISTATDFTVGAVTGPGPTYSSVLMFKSLKTSQAGGYTCTAVINSVTEMSSTVVSVTSMSIHNSTVSRSWSYVLGRGDCGTSSTCHCFS